MKRVLAFALIFLLAMGGALAEAGAGWRLDAHSLVVTVGEERFAPDLSYELEALAEGSALYAESAVRLGDDELFPMQAMFDGDELTVRLDGSDAYRFDPDSGVFDEPESLSIALALTAAMGLDARALAAEFYALLVENWPEDGETAALDGAALVAMLDGWLAAGGAPVQAAAAQYVSEAVGGPTRAVTVADALAGLELTATLENSSAEGVVILSLTLGEGASVAFLATRFNEGGPNRSFLTMGAAVMLAGPMPPTDGPAPLTANQWMFLMDERGGIAATPLSDEASGGQLSASLSSDGGGSQLHLSYEETYAPEDETLLDSAGTTSVEISATGDADGVWHADVTASRTSGTLPDWTVEFALELAPAQVENPLADAEVIPAGGLEHGTAGLLLAQAGQTADLALLLGDDLVAQIADALGQAWDSVSGALAGPESD